MGGRNLSAVVEVANRYAAELESQFRLLNHFVRHGGEIGRAHESYLRGVLARYLPPRFRTGSGFVASADWTSTQQDIIVFDGVDHAPLLEIGDCVVANAESVAGCIEVKTALNTSKEISEAIDALITLGSRDIPFVGLYCWEGASRDTMLKVIWKRLRKNFGSRAHLPHIIYVRSKYLLLHQYWGVPAAAGHYVCLDVAKASDGEALLRIIGMLYACGLSRRSRVPQPWWFSFDRLVAKPATRIAWPPDLLAILQHP